MHRVAHSECNRLRVAFYKGEGTIVDKLVRWWTKSPYSHVELLFEDGLFCSSSPRDGGVRFKVIDLDGKWDVIEVPVPARFRGFIWQFCKLEQGQKYDYIGIMFSIIVKIGYQNRNKWFCSEFVTTALQMAGYVKRLTPHKTTPGQLYSAMKTNLYFK